MLYPCSLVSSSALTFRTPGGERTTQANRRVDRSIPTRREVTINRCASASRASRTTSRRPCGVGPAGSPARRPRTPRSSKPTTTRTGEPCGRITRSISVSGEKMHRLSRRTADTGAMVGARRSHEGRRRRSRCLGPLCPEKGIFMRRRHLAALLEDATQLRSRRCLIAFASVCTWVRETYLYARHREAGPHDPTESRSTLRLRFTTGGRFGHRPVPPAPPNGESEDESLNGWTAP